VRSVKPTFLNHDHPLMTVMIQTETPEHAIRTIHRAIPEGADAFGLQTCRLRHEFRNESALRRIFEEMEGRPSYVTNYRGGVNAGTDDDTVAGGMLLAARAGGTLIDVMGDLYAKHPDELTDDPRAVDKQKKLIDILHNHGAEVLMSSHVLRYTPAERVLEIAQAQVKRGADIVKIVTGAEDDGQQAENLKIVTLLKKELKVPFLYLSGGKCEVLRRVGPMLGCCMWLCVYEHDELSTKAQPLLRNIRAIRDHFV